MSNPEFGQPNLNKPKIIDNDFNQKFKRKPTPLELALIGASAFIAAALGGAANEIDKQNTFQDGTTFIVKNDTDCLKGNVGENLIDERTGEIVTQNTIVTVSKKTIDENFPAGYFRGDVPSDDVRKVNRKNNQRYIPHIPSDNITCMLPTNTVRKQK